MNIKEHNKNSSLITGDIIAYSAAKCQAEIYDALHNLKLAHLHLLKVRQAFSDDDVLSDLDDVINSSVFDLSASLSRFDDVGVCYGC